MKPTETAADQKAKLHQDAIRKLDLLSEKIDSGELTFEEGIAKSEEYLEQVHVQNMAFSEEHQRELQRSNRRRKLITIVGFLALAYLAFQLYALFTGPAP